MEFMRQLRKGCTYPVKRLPVIQPDDPNVRHVPLTRGQVAIVDVGDYERVIVKHWSAQWNRSTETFYARLSHGGPSMHRFILGLSDRSIQCDHINGDTLDNRRQNLRPATSEQNRHNKGKCRKSKSGHAGVFWHKRDARWATYISLSGKRIHLGYFRDKEEAIRRRQQAELQLYGDFAFTARPEQLKDYAARCERIGEVKPDTRSPGVSWHRNKWRARINLNGKEISLGRFNNQDDAIKARMNGEIKYGGEYPFAAHHDALRHGVRRLG